MRVLVTGFAPFGGDAGNPSERAVEELAASWRADAEGARLTTAVLPVEFGTAGDVLADLIARHDPDLVIATGLAGGRSRISVERVAINLDDARIPDNAGAQPIDRAIDADGPAARFSSLPVKAIVAELAAAGLPAEASTTAGTFVCNHVFYRLLAALERMPRARGGFVHLPYADDDAPEGQPALPLGDLTRGLAVAVRCALARTDDIHSVGGALH